MKNKGVSRAEEKEMPEHVVKHFLALQKLWLNSGQEGINKDLGGVMEKTFTIPYEAWCKDEAEWSITAMDNTGFKLDCKYGIITLSDRYGNGICDFMVSDISKCIGNLN